MDGSTRDEIDRFRIAASDMRQAAAGAHHLAAIPSGEVDRMNGDAERALEAGIIVCYARPFSRRQGIGTVERDEWLSDERQLDLHDALIFLRNRLFAHTDKTDLRGTDDVFGDGHFSESRWLLPETVWQRIGLLADMLARRFDGHADELQDRAE